MYTIQLVLYLSFKDDINLRVLDFCSKSINYLIYKTLNLSLKSRAGFLNFGILDILE